MFCLSNALCRFVNASKAVVQLLMRYCCSLMMVPYIRREVLKYRFISTFLSMRVLGSTYSSIVISRRSASSNIFRIVALHLTKLDWPSSFSISFRENDEVMFSDDVEKVGFADEDTVVPEEQDGSMAMIRIVCKRYEEERSRLECCDRDKK